MISGAEHLVHLSSMVYAILGLLTIIMLGRASWVTPFIITLIPVAAANLYFGISAV